MIWHFLKCFFWLFLPIVIYVSIFQFSGADFIILDGGNEFIHADLHNSYFGFTSILTFISEIGDDIYLQMALDNFKQVFSILQRLSSLGLDKFLNQINSLTEEGGNYFTIMGLVITFNISAFFGILVLPMVTLFFLVACVIDLILIIVVFITKFNMLLTGSYNVILPSAESESISVSILFLKNLYIFNYLY